MLGLSKTLLVLVESSYSVAFWPSLYSFGLALPAVITLGLIAEGQDSDVS